MLPVTRRMRDAVVPTDWGRAGPLALAWLLVMLAIPLAEVLMGQLGRTGGLVAAVMLLALTVVVLLAGACGAVAAARMAIVIVGLAWLAEAAGAATGVPFGAYSYTDLLEPQLLDVPLLIPLAWLMMLPAAWAVGARLAGRAGGAAFIVFSALSMTAWDLFLDPQMVAWGLWVWHEPGGYFGVPLVNFLGWLLVSGAMTVLARPSSLPLRPLLVLYTLTALIEFGGLAFFWGLTGPAIVGGLAMGGLALAAWTVRRPWT